MAFKRSRVRSPSGPPLVGKDKKPTRLKMRRVGFLYLCGHIRRKFFGKVERYLPFASTDDSYPFNYTVYIGAGE